MAIRTPHASSDVPSESADIVAEINITPLTDIFLVLLIIFMVTSSVMSQLGVNVQLPEAGAAASSTSESQPVLVTLLPDGKLAVNGAFTTIQGLEPALRQAFLKGTSRTVVLEGDRKAFLGFAVEVMDRARTAGARKFAIATAPGESR